MSSKQESTNSTTVRCEVPTAQNEDHQLYKQQQNQENNPIYDQLQNQENNKLYDQLQNQKKAETKVDKFNVSHRKTQIMFILTILFVAVASAALTYLATYYTNNRDITNTNNTRTNKHSLSNLRFPKVLSYCPVDWKTYKKLCYKHFSTKKVWQEARDTCLSIGIDLVSVHDLEENEFLAKTFTSYSQWIGLNDLTSEGTFVWSDGSPYNFSFWRPDEPNNFWDSENCVSMDAVSGTWNDDHCLTSLEFTCKMKTTRKCGEGKWVIFNGSCYDFSRKEIEALSWNEARNNCTNRGSDLAIVHSITEHNFLMSLLADDQFNTWWIGLYRNISEWTWTDGSKLDFQFWQYGRPLRQNNTCIGIKNNVQGNWIDEICSSKQGFICEKKL